MKDYRDEVVTEVIIRDALREDSGELEYLDSVDTSEVNISRRTDKKIRRRIKKYFREKNETKSARVARKALVASLAAVLLAVSLCLSVGAIRGTVLNATVGWYENCIEFIFHSDRERIQPLTRKEPSYLPDIVDGKKDAEIGNTFHVTYLHDDKILINYEQCSKSSWMMIRINNDGVKKTDVKINRCDGEMYKYEDGGLFLIWEDGEYLYNLGSYDGRITSDEMIKIAESVK